MNRQDCKRIEAIIRKANELMDTPPTVNPRVTNADVVDGIIADLQNALQGRNGGSLDNLIEIDSQ